MEASNILEEEEGWEKIATKMHRTRISLELNINQGLLQNLDDNFQLTNKELVGQYLIDVDRGILKNIDGSIRREPHRIFTPPKGSIKFKKEIGLPNPFQFYDDIFSMTPIVEGLFDYKSVLPNIDFIIGRGCIKKILHCLDINGREFTRKGFEFKLKRIDNFIMVIDREKWVNEPAFGHSFERKLISCNTSNNADLKANFHRIIKSDLGDLSLLIGFEVDCVLNQPPDYSSVELKSHNSHFEPDLVDYWYVLSASDTKYLCIGGIDKSTGTLKKVTYTDVDKILPVDHEVKKYRYSQLYHVLKWIKIQFELYEVFEATLKYDPKFNTKLVLQL